MKYPKLNKQFINLRILLEQICESDDKETGVKDSQLTMRMKVLFTISSVKNCPPAQIIEQLCIAKSNLAILCKGLLDEGLITSEKTESDKRNIYYNLTKKGEEELNHYFDALEKKTTGKLSGKDLKIIEKKVDDLVVLLNKSASKKRG